MLDTVLLGIFPLFMVLAALSDVATMKIPNRLVLVMLAAFPVVALVSGMHMDVALNHLMAGGMVLAGGFALFAVGWIGGGDAKFAAATALWLGLPALVPYIVYAAIVGGVLTVALVLLRRFQLPLQMLSVRWVGRLHDTRSGVPYGVALGGAGLFVYAYTPLFAALTG